MIATSHTGMEDLNGGGKVILSAVPRKSSFQMLTVKNTAVFNKIHHLSMIVKLMN